MYRDVREVANLEVRTFLRHCRDLNPEQQQHVNALVDRLVNKLMHLYVTTVRQQSASGFDSEQFDSTTPGPCIAHTDALSAAEVPVE